MPSLSDRIALMKDGDFADFLHAPAGTRVPCAAFIERLRWNADGLIPVVTQCAESGEVLMQAWMNRAALAQTLATGVMTYYSRSQGRLWEKGERSKQRQILRRLSTDCDTDCLLAQVEQIGVACHTGRRSCFYISMTEEHAEVATDPTVSPDSLYGES